ncbi:MAG: hypothetical protein ACNYPH_06480 [Gammaproteobacteria bacterium WSBS_2016_MAG_OTU1]
MTVSESYTEEEEWSLSKIIELFNKRHGTNFKSYTEEEERSLSEIIKSFNERHGTNFTREDFLRFELVNKEIMDDDMKDMMLNNPADVVYGAFAEKFFQGMIDVFQKDNELQNLVMNDGDAREQATRHFFKRAKAMVEQLPPLVRG